MALEGVPLPLTSHDFFLNRILYYIYAMITYWFIGCLYLYMYVWIHIIDIDIISI